MAPSAAKPSGPETGESHQGDDFTPLPIRRDLASEAEPHSIPQRAPHFANGKRPIFCLEGALRRNWFPMHSPGGDFEREPSAN